MNIYLYVYMYSEYSPISSPRRSESSLFPNQEASSPPMLSPVSIMVESPKVRACVCVCVCVVVFVYACVCEFVYVSLCTRVYVSLPPKVGACV